MHGGADPVDGFRPGRFGARRGTGSASFPEPHPSKEPVPPHELMVESGGDMEHDEREEKPCDESLGNALGEDREISGQRLGRVAEDDGEEPGPDRRGKSAQHHSGDEHIEAPVGEDADAVEQGTARGGTGRILGSDPGQQANDEEHADHEAKAHVPGERHVPVRALPRHLGKDESARCERDEDHDAHDPMQGDEERVVSSHEASPGLGR